MIIFVELTLDYAAFYGCRGLTSIKLPESVSEICDEAFRGCSSLTAFEIPNSVKVIRHGTFAECSNLISIKIPDSVTEICNQAFMDCKSLFDVEIPNSVIGILGDNAFAGCDNLTSVTIGSGVNEIAFCAFYGCSQLKNIYSRNPIPPIVDEESFIFDGIDKNTCALIVPASSLSAYREAPGWRLFFNIIGYDVVGVDNAVNENDCNIYSKNGTIVIDGANDRVEIYSANGTCVYQGTAGCIANLSEGLYIVRVGRQSTKIAFK